VLVEIGDPRYRAHDVSRLVHHDRGCGAEARAELGERVEIHRAVDDLRGGNQADRRAARDDGEQIVPAAANAAGVLVDQLAEWDRHRLFDVAGVVDVPGNA